MKRIYTKPVVEVIRLESSLLLTDSQSQDITTTLTMPIVETIIITSDTDVH